MRPPPALHHPPGDEETRKPHIRHQVVQPLGAQPQAPSLGASRQRPLIYVYDLPPLYNARIMQYRGDRFMCAWRGYEQNNGFTPTDWTYASEQYLHEAMLQSPHRWVREGGEEGLLTCMLRW